MAQPKKHETKGEKIGQSRGQSLGASQCMYTISVINL